MCFAKGNPAPEADRTKIKAAFTADIRQRIDVEESVIGKVFDTIASGDITIADGFRWLGLFPARNSAPSTVDPERLKTWLTEYSLSELYDKNVLGGRP